MIDQEIQLALDEKQDEILTGMPVPQDGKVGDIRTNIAHKGKFYQMMKVGTDTHFFSAPFSRTPSIHTMDDYLLKSGGRMLDGAKLDAYDVTVRSGLTLSGLAPGDAVLVLDGTGKVVTDENLTWDGSELVVTGSQDIIYTATEPDNHALEIEANAAGFGDVKALEIDYITGAIVDGQDEGIILLNIDESLADGGEVFGLEVLATEGDATIWGLKAAALVGPIHQDSGVFSNMDSALVNAVDRRAEFISAASDIAIFVADNDTVTIGNAAKFEEIEFLLATVASGAGIKPTFEFSTGASPTTWAAFTPVDGTDGLKHNGIIAWDDVDIPSWAVDGNSEYLIRITRTRNSLSTVPIEDKVQIASTTTYTWDQSGDIYIRNLGRDADNLLDFATDNEITFRVGAADRGTWTATGLGIGTAAPAYKEEIVDTSSGAETVPLALHNNSTANNTAVALAFISHTSVITGKIANIHIGASDYRMDFYNYYNTLKRVMSLYQDIVQVEYAIKMKERAAALGDTAAYGQLWVKTATPCELWFTDDAGTDTQIV